MKTITIDYSDFQHNEAIINQQKETIIELQKGENINDVECRKHLKELIKLWQPKKKWYQLWK